MATDPWEARIRKYDDDFNVGTATKDELVEFIQTKMYLYEQDKVTDDNLWDGFRIDFKDFTPQIMGSILWRELQKLRAYLRCGGVFVRQNSTHLTIAQGLCQVLEEEVQHVWTDAEINEARTDLQKGPITSVYLSLQDGNARLKPLPFQQAQNSQNEPFVPIPLVPIPLPIPPINLSTNANGAQPVPTAKLITEIVKMYSEKDKYDGTGSFDYKLSIFIEVCQRLDLHPDMYMRAFPTMLMGLALDHFYSARLQHKTFAEACDSMHRYFEGPGFYRSNLDE
jgi:hypothetical protein